MSVALRGAALYARHPAAAVTTAASLMFTGYMLATTLGPNVCFVH